MIARSMLLGAVCAWFVSAGAPLGASAANLHVPSEYPTIQSAIDASVDGDVVVVAPGVYTGAGNRNLDPGTREITILGEGGPDETVIDCEQQGRGLWVHGGQTEAFQFVGFTVRNGFAGQGAGFRVDQGSKVTISDCVFESCQANGYACYGEGILRRSRFTGCDSDYTLDWRTGRIEECEIVENGGWGLLVSYPYDGEILIDRTLVSGNELGGMRLVVNYLAITIQRCVLWNNGGTASHMSAETPITFRECTIAGDDSSVLDHGSVLFDRCILSGLDCWNFYNWGTVTLICSLFYPDGLYGDLILTEGGHVDGDPMYCVPTVCYSESGSRGDFSLRDDSPCLPENSPCGEQIGAFGLGCAAAAVEGAPSPGGAGITFTSAMPARDALRFRLNPASPGSPDIVGAFPAEATGPVGFEVVTLSGRRITSRRVPAVGPGAEIEWRPEEDGVRMDSGIYFLRATRADGSKTSAKFVWLE